MQIAPYSIKKFLGIDNINRPEDVDDNRFQAMDNVDIDNNGSLRRRMGSEILDSGAKHSVATDGFDLIFREDTDLKRYNPDGTVDTLQSGFQGSRTLNNLLLNGILYYSDGVTSGVYQNRQVRTLGLEIPPTPTLTATVGDLIPGRYTVALTYLRNDGQESGACQDMHVDATAGGFTVSVTPSSDSTVDGIAVYVSSVDGEILYRQAVVTNAAASLTISGGLLADGVELETQHCSAPPQWQAAAFYRGRVYYATGDTIIESEPWKYELVNWDRGHSRLDGEIVMLAPVENGIWTGTKNEVVFLAGADPRANGGFQVRRYKSRVLKGASLVVSSSDVSIRGIAPGPVAIWAGPDGVFAGDSSGNMIPLTSDFFALPDVEEGWACLVKEDGMDRVFFGVKSGAGYGSVAVSVIVA